MQPTHLRVRARGQSLVHSLEAMNANPREFIGRHWTTVDGLAALAPTGEDVLVPNRSEYVQAVKEGSLWPADKETADVCDVAFDPSFGGEHAVTKSSSRSKHRHEAASGGEQ